MSSKDFLDKDGESTTKMNNYSSVSSAFSTNLHLWKGWPNTVVNPTNKWLFSEALLACWCRRQLKCQYHRNQIDTNHRAYRAACRCANWLLKVSAVTFRPTKLAQTTDDNRGRGTIIKELLHSGERPAKRDVEENVQCNQKMCNAFCKFFSSKIAAISTKICCGMLLARVPLNHSIPRRFTGFSYVSDEDAIHMIAAFWRRRRRWISFQHQSSSQLVMYSAP